jgi:hypothetical protein
MSKGDFFRKLAPWSRFVPPLLHSTLDFDDTSWFPVHRPLSQQRVHQIGRGRHCISFAASNNIQISGIQHASLLII